MRPANSNAAAYSPGEPPIDPVQLQRFLREEHAKIQSAINALAAGHRDKVYVVPAKPREGDERFADGTSWNPGGGKGLYMYSSGVWTLIKALP